MSNGRKITVDCPAPRASYNKSNLSDLLLIDSHPSCRKFPFRISHDFTRDFPFTRNHHSRCHCHSLSPWDGFPWGSSHLIKPCQIPHASFTSLDFTSLTLITPSLVPMIMSPVRSATPNQSPSSHLTSYLSFRIASESTTQHILSTLSLSPLSFLSFEEFS